MLAFALLATCRRPLYGSRRQAAQVKTHAADRSLDRPGAALLDEKRVSVPGLHRSRLKSRGSEFRNSRRDARHIWRIQSRCGYRVSRYSPALRTRLRGHGVAPQHDQAKVYA